jgi:hypothetical protein
MQCDETGWRLLDHGELREQYGDMIVRMQGKRLLFAGDSLMDMIFHPFLCGAVATGWKLSDVPVGEFVTPADISAGCMAKMLTKKDHKPIVMGFMRFYNYVAGEGSVELDDVFRFPITPPEFDIIFMNMAHNAMMFRWERRQVRKLVSQLISRAHNATNVGRVVFLGHPPQHFKTKSGAYAGPETGDCMCHDKAALEKQTIFRHNQFVQALVSKDNEGSGGVWGKCVFADPWSYYMDKCETHGHLHGHAEQGTVDCTHWLESDVAAHAPFLKDLVAIALL